MENEYKSASDYIKNNIAPLIKKYNPPKDKLEFIGEKLAQLIKSGVPAIKLKKYILDRFEEIDQEEKECYKININKETMRLFDNLEANALCKLYGRN